MNRLQEIYSTYSRTIKIGLGIVAVLLLVFSCYSIVTYRNVISMKVYELSWQRKIDIVRWQTIQESDWSIPATGLKIREYSAYHHSDRYVSGHKQECSTRRDSEGHSEYECESVAIYSSRAVYQTKYDYMIDRSPITQGSDTENVVWPNISDMATEHNPPQIGDEKRGQSYEVYKVSFIDHDNVVRTIEYTYDVWKTFRKGVAYNITLNFFNTIVDVSSF